MADTGRYYVVRGHQWISGNADGGMGSYGIVIGEENNGLIAVEWYGGVDRVKAQPESKVSLSLIKSKAGSSGRPNRSPHNAAQDNDDQSASLSVAEGDNSLLIAPNDEASVLAEHRTSPRKSENVMQLSHQELSENENVIATSDASEAEDAVQAGKTDELDFKRNRASPPPFTPEGSVTSMENSEIVVNPGSSNTSLGVNGLGRPGVLENIASATNASSSTSEQGAHINLRSSPPPPFRSFQGKFTSPLAKKVLSRAAQSSVHSAKSGSVNSVDSTDFIPPVLSETEDSLAEVPSAHRSDADEDQLAHTDGPSENQPVISTLLNDLSSAGLTEPVTNGEDPSSEANASFSRGSPVGRMSDSGLLDSSSSNELQPENSNFEVQELGSHLSSDSRLNYSQPGGSRSDIPVSEGHSPMASLSDHENVSQRGGSNTNELDGGEAICGGGDSLVEELTTGNVLEEEEGSVHEHRNGKDGVYELYVLHIVSDVDQPIPCSGCEIPGIPGIRYQCSVCEGVSLCSHCFHNGQHDITHPFRCCPTFNHHGFYCIPRSESKFIQLTRTRGDIPSGYYRNCLPPLGVSGNVVAVRGPSWLWDNQDGGEGRLAVVTDANMIELEAREIVYGRWDNEGRRYDYNVGRINRHDLLLLDTFQLHMVHHTVTCVGCSMFPLEGLRWECYECPDVNLCASCYMDDKHDLSHSFLRYDLPYTTDKGPALLRKRTKERSVGFRGNYKKILGPRWAATRYYPDHLPLLAVHFGRAIARNYRSYRRRKETDAAVEEPQECPSSTEDAPAPETPQPPEEKGIDPTDQPPEEGRDTRPLEEDVVREVLNSIVDKVLVAMGDDAEGAGADDRLLSERVDSVNEDLESGSMAEQDEGPNRDELNEGDLKPLEGARRAESVEELSESLVEFAEMEEDETLKVSKYLSYVFSTRPEFALGSGSYSDVYRGYRRKTKSLVAVKRLRPQGPTSDQSSASQSTDKELSFLQLVPKHENLVQMFDYTHYEDTIFMFMEYCNLGHLEDFYKRFNVTEYTTLDLMVQVSKGLRAMHNISIDGAGKVTAIHYDIKPRNILVSSSREVVPQPIAKLADFGLCKLIEGQTGESMMASSMRSTRGNRGGGGTMQFMAPEIISATGRYKDNNPAVDVFALGLVCAGMLQYRKSKSLYIISSIPGNTYGQALSLQKAYGIPVAPAMAAPGPDASKAYAASADIINQMVAAEPEARPDSETVYKVLLEAMSGTDSFPVEIDSKPVEIPQRYLDAAEALYIPPPPPSPPATPTPLVQGLPNPDASEGDDASQEDEGDQEESIENLNSINESESEDEQEEVIPPREVEYDSDGLTLDEEACADIDIGRIDQDSVRLGELEALGLGSGLGAELGLRLRSSGLGLGTSAGSSRANIDRVIKMKQKEGHSAGLSAEAVRMELAMRELNGDSLEVAETSPLPDEVIEAARKKFHKFDIAQVTTNVYKLERLQTERGYFNSMQMHACGLKALVNRVDEEGDVFVEMIVGPNRFYFHPELLNLVPLDPKAEFEHDDLALVLDDRETVKTIQEGASGWRDQMSECLGHIVSVNKPSSSKDVVSVSYKGRHRWHFSRDILRLVAKAKERRSDYIPPPFEDDDEDEEGVEEAPPLNNFDELSQANHSRETERAHTPVTPVITGFTPNFLLASGAPSVDSKSGSTTEEEEDLKGEESDEDGGTSSIKNEKVPLEAVTSENKHDTPQIQWGSLSDDTTQQPRVSGESTSPRTAGANSETRLEENSPQAQYSRSGSEKTEHTAVSAPSSHQSSTGKHTSTTQSHLTGIDLYSSPHNLADNAVFDEEVSGGISLYSADLQTATNPIGGGAESDEEKTTPTPNFVDQQEFDSHQELESTHTAESPPVSGSLPSGWERRETDSGEAYYVDHVNKVTQWEYPNSSYMSSMSSSSSSAYTDHHSFNSAREDRESEQLASNEFGSTSPALNAAPNLFSNAPKNLVVELDSEQKELNVSKSFIAERSLTTDERTRISQQAAAAADRRRVQEAQRGLTASNIHSDSGDLSDEDNEACGGVSEVIERGDMPMVKNPSIAHQSFDAEVEAIGHLEMQRMIFVVRGKQWASGNIDGGRGGVGLVLKVTGQTTIVKWAGGRQMRHKTGADGIYELGLLAVKSGQGDHPHSCGGCGNAPVAGLLWICHECDFKLCNFCFHIGVATDPTEHTHKKFRLLTESSSIGLFTQPREPGNIINQESRPEFLADDDMQCIPFSYFEDCLPTLGLSGKIFLVPSMSIPLPSEAGGEGGLGMISKNGQDSFEGSLHVDWMHPGSSAEYRHDDPKFREMRLLDAVELGVVHDVSCGECNISPLRGFLWRCAESCLGDKNLCSPCFFRVHQRRDHSIMLWKSQYDACTMIPANFGSGTQFRPGFDQLLPLWEGSSSYFPSLLPTIEFRAGVVVFSSVDHRSPSTHKEYIPPGTPEEHDSFFTRENVNEATIAGKRVISAGSFRISEEASFLAEGGFGHVLLGWCAEKHEFVAVKMVGARSTKEAVRREWNCMRTCQHPNLVKMHACIQMLTTRVFFVMEYCNGLSLGEFYCHQDHVHDLTAARLMVDAATGLDYMHGFPVPGQADSHARIVVVHRDIKPGNILVHHVHGSRPVAKLADFGMAKMLEASDGSMFRDGYHKAKTDSAMSGGATAAGTAFYFPPPVEYSSGSATPSMDVYSIGLTFYGMMTWTKKLQFNIHEDLVAHGASSLGTKMLYSKQPEAEFAKYESKQMGRVWMALVPLVRKMVSCDPSIRPNMKEVHTVVTQLKDLIETRVHEDPVITPPPARNIDPFMTDPWPTSQAMAGASNGAQAEGLSHNNSAHGVPPRQHVAVTDQHPQQFGEQRLDLQEYQRAPKADFYDPAQQNEGSSAEWQVPPDPEMHRQPPVQGGGVAYEPGTDQASIVNRAVHICIDRIGKRNQFQGRKQVKPAEAIQQVQQDPHLLEQVTAQIAGNRANTPNYVRVSKRIHRADVVQVVESPGDLQRLQKGRNIWNPRILSTCGMKGIVNRVDHDGDVFVELIAGPNYYYNADALTVRNPALDAVLNPGDQAMLLEDDVVRFLMHGAGLEWNEVMEEACGHMVDIVQSSAETVKISHHGLTFIVGKNCVKLVATATEILKAIHLNYKG